MKSVSIKPAHSNMILSLIIFKNYIVSGGYDCKMKFWNLSNQKLDFSINTNSEINKILHVHMNSDYFIVGDKAGTLQVYSLSTSNLLLQQ
jgi:WD40 repeat protein